MPDSPSPKKRPWLTGSGFARGRKSQNSKFYESTAWRKLRAMFIRTNPVCIECGRTGAMLLRNVHQMKAALGDALDHVESQSVKRNERKV